MKFVRAKRNQIGIEGMDGIQRKLSKPLRGVRVERNALRTAKSADFLDRLDGANHIVGRHDRHQNRVGADESRDINGRHQATAVDRDFGNREPFFIKKIFTGPKDGRVFDR